MTVIEEEAEDLGFLLEPLEEEKIEKEKESENNKIGCGSCSSGSESESENDKIGCSSCPSGSESESEKALMEPQQGTVDCRIIQARIRRLTDLQILLRNLQKFTPPPLPHLPPPLPVHELLCTLPNCHDHSL
jgi:hypothetical protein